MVEDVKEKEKEKKEEEKAEKKEQTFFQKVPTFYKLAGVAFLVFMAMRINSEGKPLTQLWLWVAIVLLVWWFLGKEGLQRETGILTPKEARQALNQEIADMRREGIIDRWAHVRIMYQSGLKHHEGMPQHYLIGVMIIINYVQKYLQATINAEGPTKGYVTIQQHPHSFRGIEAWQTVPIIPGMLRRGAQLEKYGIDWDKFLFGEMRR